MAKERTCVCCGSKYEYCYNCNDFNSNEKWRMLYCSSDCREIVHIWDKYRIKEINAAEAKAQMTEHNVPAIDCVAEFMQPEMEEIFKTTKRSKIVNEEFNF